LLKTQMITSLQNAVVKNVAKIISSRSRHRHDSFVIEGANLVDSALQKTSRAKLQSLFYTTAFRDRNTTRLTNALIEAHEQGAKLYEVTEPIMSRITHTKTPQGIAAVAIYQACPSDDVDLNSGPLLLLDGVSDPGNLGTIIRNADAAGASGVYLLEGTCDAFSPKAMRASAGSVFNVPLLYAPDRSVLIAELKEKNVWIAATGAGDESLDIFKTDLKLPLAFVFGNEAHGISEELAAAADMTIHIPIVGKAESLNVAVASAICLYETLRTR
jgi:TrmH family RNA methyltransferase